MKQTKEQTTKVVNVENTKSAIESATELSVREKVAGYLANHAVEHYCAATGESVEEITAILSECEKESGIYWRYTCPAIGGQNSRGENNPTESEWMKQNPDAVRVDKLAGKQWFKKPTTLADALTIRSIVASYDNYQSAIAGAQKRVENTLAAAALIAGCSVEELKAKLNIK